MANFLPLSDGILMPMVQGGFWKRMKFRILGWFGYKVELKFQSQVKIPRNKKIFLEIVKGDERTEIPITGTGDWQGITGTLQVSPNNNKPAHVSLVTKDVVDMYLSKPHAREYVKGR